MHINHDGGAVVAESFYRIREEWLEDAMSIWNKVFVGLIIFVSLFFFYFSAQALKTHEYWRSSAKKHETKIVKLADEVEQLRYGVKNDETHPGLLKRQSEVYKALIGRGRVWYNCTPQQLVNPQTGEVRVGTDAPNPHGITDKTILAVFDERSQKDGGRYIGQFIVKGVTDRQLGLAPCRTLKPDALKRLAQSRGPWTLCEIMPADDHGIFAGMTAEQLEQILPKSALEEYLKDGKDGFSRKLRDYQYLFDTFDRQLSMLVEVRNTAVSNRELMEAAVADAKKQVQLRQAEIASLRTELAEMRRECDIVAAHQKSLEKEIAARTKKIQTLLKTNRAIAAEIARDQLEAVKRVDARTVALD